MKKLRKNTNKIIEAIKEDGLNELSYDYLGDIDKLVLNNYEFFFYDFTDEEKLTEEEAYILNCFSFSVAPTGDYHHQYFSAMNLTLNQLNYGIKFSEISDEGELETILLDRIEIGNIEDEQEKENVINLLIDIIDTFIASVYEVEDMIFRGELEV